MGAVAEVLHNDALVLNKSFHAIQIVGWKRAISLLLNGVVVALDENLQPYNFNDWAELSKMMEIDPNHPEKYIRGSNCVLAVPTVLRLLKFDRLPKRHVKLNRRSIYNHYGGMCCYCGKKLPPKQLNLDHVIPRSRGGLSTWDNLVTACYPCNTKKADRTPEEAHMPLLRKPTKPSWKGQRMEIIQLRGLGMHPSWERLIAHAYWNTEPIVTGKQWRT